MERRILEDFVFESWSVIFIIFLNVSIYLVLRFIPISINHFYSLVASWDNITGGNVACLLTAGFIHRNLSHLFLNMAGIFIFGRVVERHFGFLKTLYIFFGAQVLSMLLAVFTYYYMFGVNMHIIGASGGLMGLIGCAMLVEPFYISYEMLLPLPVMLKGWMFIFADWKGFLGGEKDGISHLTHLFGFFSIAVLVYFLSRQDKKKMRQGLIINLFFLMMFVGMNLWLEG